MPHTLSFLLKLSYAGDAFTCKPRNLVLPLRYPRMSVRNEINHCQEGFFSLSTECFKFRFKCGFLGESGSGRKHSVEITLILLYPQNNK